MRMQAFSMRPTPAAERELTSSSRKMTLFPRFNGAILSIAQIIKFVMASAAESELAALFVMAREMIPHRQTLIAMGWPQPKTPIQTDNSTAVGRWCYQQNNCSPPGKNDGYAFLVASMPRIPRPISILLGCWIKKTGLITTLNFTQTPTMKPTGQLMLVSGTRC